jgi:hypothetical protein
MYFVVQEKIVRHLVLTGEVPAELHQRVHGFKSRGLL